MDSMTSKTKIDPMEMSWGQLKDFIASLSVERQISDEQIKMMRMEAERQRKKSEERLSAMKKENELRRKKFEENLAKMKKETELQRKKFEENLAKMKKETELQRKKSEESLAEMKKETELQRKKSEESLAEMKKETERLKQENEKQFRETDEQLKKTKELIDANARALDKLEKKQARTGDEWGRFLEEMCVPASIKIFMDEGIKITQRYTGMTHAYDDDGDEMEVDVILCNSVEAVAIEVKSCCSKEDIDHFLKQMKFFKKIFHPFDRFKVYAAIVGVKFQNGVEKYARRQGLYVIHCTAEGAFSLVMKPEPDQRLCY